MHEIVILALTVSVIILLPGNSTESKCNFSIENIKTNCTYILRPLQRTKSQAVTSCSKKDAHLLYVTTATSFRSLPSLLENCNPVWTSLDFCNGVWLWGGNTVLNQTFEDDNGVVYFLPWSPGHPLNDSRYACAIIDENINLVNVNCSERNIYICHSYPCGYNTTSEAFPTCTGTESTQFPTASPGATILTPSSSTSASEITGEFPATTKGALLPAIIVGIVLPLFVVVVTGIIVGILVKKRNRRRKRYQRQALVGDAGSCHTISGHSTVGKVVRRRSSMSLDVNKV